jgi:hypothetical protein
MKKFDELYKTIVEEVTQDIENVHPTCVYCGCDVPVERYLEQKKSYEEFTGVKDGFKPSSCHCEKCSEALKKMYSGGSKWTGD